MPAGTGLVADVRTAAVFDESTMALGVALYAAAALDFLSAWIS